MLQEPRGAVGSRVQLRLQLRRFGSYLLLCVCLLPKTLGLAARGTTAGHIMRWRHCCSLCFVLVLHDGIVQSLSPRVSPARVSQHGARSLAATDASSKILPIASGAPASAPASAPAPPFPPPQPFWTRNSVAQTVVSSILAATVMSGVMAPPAVAFNTEQSAIAETWVREGRALGLCVVSQCFACCDRLMAAVSLLSKQKISTARCISAVAQHATPNTKRRDRKHVSSRGSRAHTHLTLCYPRATLKVAGGHMSWHLNLGSKAVPMKAAAYSKIRAPSALYHVSRVHTPSC